MPGQQLSNSNMAEGGQYLSFYLGGEAFGVDILRVQEIRGWEQVRPLPDSPEYVKGVLDLRGTIVPIVDLRMRFGVSEPVYEPTTVVIIVSVAMPGGDDQLVGMAVDGVSDVLDTSQVEVKPPPTSVAGIGRRYLIGMLSTDDGVVILVDADTILSDQELAGVRA